MINDKAGLLLFAAIVQITIRFCSGAEGDVICHPTLFKCQCGQAPPTGHEFNIETKQCTYFHGGRPYCKPCDDKKEADVCPLYEQCQECKEGEERCITCPPNKYGLWCSGDCQCQNGGSCDRDDGHCTCPSGYAGSKCEIRNESSQNQCGEPDRVKNANMFITFENGAIREGNSYPVGTKYEYKCDYKYMMEGQPIRHCLNDGNWSGKAPTCTPACGEGPEPKFPHIVGGTVAEGNGYPWQVGITLYFPGGLESRNIICGGVLLNEAWVLTAAHCVTLNGTRDKRDTKEFKLYFGKHYYNFNFDNNEVENRGVQQLIVHDNYNPWTLDCDIALIFLKTPLTFSDRIVPLCLPVINSSITFEDGRKGVIAGWGDTNKEGDIPVELMEVELPVINSAKCQKNYSRLTFTENMYCAGVDEGGKNVCSGDSGGAMAFYENQRYVLEGLVSWGNKDDCAAPGFYGAFVRVRNFALWIRQYTGLVGPVDTKKVTTYVAQGCPLPTAPSNGKVEITKSATDGRLANVTGTIINQYAGVNVTYAHSSRIAVLPKTRRQATSPSSLPSGYSNVNSRALYSCDSTYYRLQGPSSRICLANGQWSGKDPKCKAVCGKSTEAKSPTIANGEVSDRGRWPWHVGISHFDSSTNLWKLVCGGSLVSEDTVVTAARCVALRKTSTPKNITEYRIYLGKYFRNDHKDDSEVVVMGIKSIDIHPDYHTGSWHSDIAIVKLVLSVKYSSRIQPVCLPESDKFWTRIKANERNLFGMVIGWGDAKTESEANALHEAKLPIVSSSKCKDEFRKINISLTLTSNMFCAGSEGGSGICKGDSGGSLVVQEEESSDTGKRWILEGLIIWGHANCEAGGFLNILNFLEWIEQHL